MKTVIMFISLAIICTFTHSADDTSYIAIEQQENVQLFHYHDKGQRTTFYQDMLQKSRLIKKIDHKTPEIYASLVQQLCKDRSSLELLLLREALKRDAVDQHKQKEPSADTIDFANNDVRPKDLCWLTNTASFWDIKYTYKALIQRIAHLLEQGRINVDTQILNSDAMLEVLDQVNLFGLKITIAKKLQEEITHNIPMDQLTYQAELNANGSQVLLAYPESGKPYNWIPKIKVYVYNIPDKTITKDIIIDTDEKCTEITYHNNETQALVETKNNLFVYNLTDGTLFKKIKLQSNLESRYARHNALLLIAKKDTVDLYDTQQNTLTNIKSYEPAGFKGVLDVAFNPTGTEIAITIIFQMLFYATSNRTLIRSIPLYYGLGYLMYTYNTDGSQLLFTHDNYARLFDTSNNKPAQTILDARQHQQSINSFAFNSDNKRIFLHVDNEIRTYQNNDIKELISTLQLDPEISRNKRSILFNHDGSRVVVSDHESMSKWTTSIYNMINNAKLCTIESPIRPVLDYHARHLLVPQYGHIKLYDLRTTNHKTVATVSNSSYLLANRNHTESQLLIVTPNKFIIHPTLPDLNLNSLSLEQLNLLFKASKQWKNQETYALKKADATCYISLPPALQTDKLFTLAPRITPS